jgi:hypothetical protein
MEEGRRGLSAPTLIQTVQGGGYQLVLMPAVTDITPETEQE